MHTNTHTDLITEVLYVNGMVINGSANVESDGHYNIIRVYGQSSQQTLPTINYNIARYERGS